MSGDQPADTKAAAEAADWFAKLNSRVITTGALEGFAQWRREPENRDAYHRLEALWRRTEHLDADPDIQSAVQDAADRPARALQRKRRAAWSWAIAGLAIVATAGVAGGPKLFERLEGTVYETPVGVQSTFRLVDGTSVRLDTGSRILVRISPKGRRVRLERGQVFFNVAHDASRPFLVFAGSSRVRDIGTAFDVRLDGQRAKVTLVEGSVQVQDAGGQGAATWTLRPGQQLSVGAARPAAVRSVNAATTTSWTTGHLVFQATPLAEAVREVARYSRAPLELEDQNLAQTPMNGTFDAGDVGAFVAATTAILPLKADRLESGAIILRAKTPAA